MEEMMSGDRVPMTPEGYKNLQKELQKLKTVDRQEVIKLIEYARSLGDLSENAEYVTAKDKQSFIESRIQELDGKLARAEVIDPNSITNRDRVVFGLTVTIEDVETSEKRKYQLVGADESDPDNGKISITSPIGSALIGKEIDDDIQVRTPGGLREFMLVNIE
jgi:transcription elongation factor GreA